MATSAKSCTIGAFVLLCLMFFVGYRRLTGVFFISETVHDFRPCVTGIPCVYDNEVDFRIIVLTFNRAESLVKLLQTIDEVELDGDKGALEIWIDRNSKGIVDQKTYEAARSFQWKRGPTRVHIQTTRAGIYGQWIDTWRPRNHKTKEIPLILEDDIIVSKYIYRWIKVVHRAYNSRNDFAGTTLTSDELTSHDGANRILIAPRAETIFMYKCIGTWGFSPKQTVWSSFQDWYHEYSKKPNFHPYVTGILPTKWYKKYEQSGTADSMWEQWFIYYAHVHKLFTVYNNLKYYTMDGASCLCINRREAGLHIGYKGPEDYCQLLSRWDSRFVALPAIITKLDWNGNRIQEY